MRLNLELKMTWCSYVIKVSHVFLCFNVKKNFFEVKSTEHLTVPYSAFCGKENAILRKENK